MKTILVIEDDEAIRSNILDLLDAEGFAPVGAANGREGYILAEKDPPDLIVCDIMMPELGGLELLEQIRNHATLAATPFIFLSARAERADIRSGMKLGADDYVTKPFTRVELLDAIQSRLRRQEVLMEAGRGSNPNISSGSSTAPNSERRPPPRRAPAVVLQSELMRELYDQATRAAQTTLSVLLLGETGVGKEVLAAEIHRRSPRASGPFVPINCAALSPSLLESELFGHEKGSFTGAGSAQPGLFEAADGGTVFLDEIGELDASIQVKLLRVLEDRRVMRVGSRRSREVDVRFISATNRDLEQEVELGDFRRDLYFRLNGIALEIPPLRARREEISLLARHFLGPESPPFDADALALLERYDFPGNVRELKNIVERAVALSSGDVIRPAHLPPGVRDGASPSAPHTGGATEVAAHRTPMDQLRADMNELERKRIIDALEACGGNQTKAAEMLGISRRTLVSRLDAYGLPRPRKGK